MKEHKIKNALCTRSVSVTEKIIQKMDLLKVYKNKTTDEFRLESNLFFISNQ